MKLLFSWVVFSSFLSLLIIVNAPLVMPTLEKQQSTATSVELQLLNDLLEIERIDREVLNSLVIARKRDFKGDVIKSQLESLPLTLTFLPLLILNALNISFTMLGFWYVRTRKKAVSTYSEKRNNA